MYKKSSIVSKKDMIPSISSLTKNQEYAHSSKNTRFIYPPLSPNNANLHQNGIIPNSKYGASKRINSNFNMDIPSQTDPHGPAIIYGVESEELEEIRNLIARITGKVRLHAENGLYKMRTWRKPSTPFVGQGK